MGHMLTWATRATRSPTSRWTWSSGRQSLHDSFTVDDYGTPTTYRNSTPEPPGVRVLFGGFYELNPLPT